VELQKKQIIAHLQTHGLEGGVIPVDRLPLIRDEINKWHHDKMLSDEVHSEYIAWFDYDHQNFLPEARSIITVAVPDVQTKIIFTWHKETHPFTVPPTYLHWHQINKKAEDVLLKILVPARHKLVPAKLPLKLTAMHSGIGQYGRNNVFYIANKGSFHRLACFFSDCPCGEDGGSWVDLSHLPRCEKCDICVKSCPTGAIHRERFLVSAERCITFHNERSGDIPFPDWLKPAWHNCLVGCMICQKVCPENKAFLQHIRPGATFTQNETELLVGKKLPDILPPELEAKLKESDLLEILDIIPRNLRALLGIDS
jgi:epoxyqueuosine reductase